MVKLTHEEAESLCDYIELHLMDTIRADQEIDNMMWLANMCSIWAKCERELKAKEQLKTAAKGGLDNGA